MIDTDVTLWVRAMYGAHVSFARPVRVKRNKQALAMSTQGRVVTEVFVDERLCAFRVLDYGRTLIIEMPDEFWDEFWFDVVGNLSSLHDHIHGIKHG